MATITGSALTSHRKLLDICLWIAQLVLASVFVVTGSLKLGLPSERLVETMAWADGVPVAIVRALGVCELLGAFALLIPTALHVRERVAGAVASGFTVLALGLATISALRLDLRVLPIHLALAALAAFVAWGRGAHPELDAQAGAPR